MPRPRHYGFTLIEMSVVIVIVGLLLGAVVIGRGYIKNGELNAIITESRYYINAFGQFREKYNAPPGDMANASQFWSGAINGDGNGRIRAGSTLRPLEVFQSFQHLVGATLIEGRYTGTTTGGAGTVYARIGTNVPRAAMTGVTYIFDHPNALDGNIDTAAGLGDAYYFDGLYSHILRVAAIATSENGLPGGVFLTPAEALELDTKYDDSIPGNGWIMTPKTLSDCVTSSDPAVAAYNTAVTDPACNFVLRLQ